MVMAQSFIADTMTVTTETAETTEQMQGPIAVATTEDHTNATPTSNPSLQRTPGRSDASHKIMKTHSPHSALAPASGR
jgi:hypothetical protein